MLTVENVVKARTLAGGERLEVLRGVSFEVDGGGAACLLGPSGGGKSTVLRCINRLEDPDAGTIRLNGSDIREIPVVELRRRVGLVLQKPTLFEGTVYDNVIAAFGYSGEKAPASEDERLLRLLRLVRLDASLLSRRSTELSLGQQQRVAVVRTLLPGPRLLLMDEPTASLDPRTGDELVGELRTLLRETRTTALIATHDLAAARRIADRVLFLDEGRIAETGNAASLFDNPRTEALRRFLNRTAPGADGAEGGEG